MLIDIRVVGAVQILDEYLGAFDENARVLSGDASLISTVVGQGDIREDAADWILSSDDDLCPAGGER